MKDEKIVEMVSCLAGAQLVVFEAIIQQCELDKAALIQHLNKVIEQQHPEPTMAAVRVFLQGFVRHFEGKATLGSKLLQ